MKAQELTDEKKNEMLVLQMRRSLDPKRFYKAPDIRGVPKFFQVTQLICLKAGGFFTLKFSQKF